MALRPKRSIAAMVTAGALVLGVTACDPEVEGLTITTEPVGGWKRVTVTITTAPALTVGCSAADKVVVNDVELVSACDQVHLRVVGSDGPDDITVELPAGGPVSVVGGAGDDSIDVTRNGDGGAVAEGGEGNDTIVMRSTTSSVATGGAGNDVLWIDATATPTADPHDERTHLVEGGDGNDLLVSGIGFTSLDAWTFVGLHGGAGDDTLVDLGVLDPGPRPPYDWWATVHYEPGAGIDVVDAARSDAYGTYRIEHQDLVRFGSLVGSLTYVD